MQQALIDNIMYELQQGEEREQEIKQLELKLTTKIDKNRYEMKSLHTKIDNIESMLTQLMSTARKRAGRRALRQNEVGDVEYIMSSDAEIC